MNKLRNILNEFYSLKNLRNFGFIGLLSCILLIAVTVVLNFLPEDKFEPSYRTPEQCFLLNPVEVKNNTAKLEKFLAGIKANNGVLTLGTSESGVTGYNYYELLSADTAIDAQFSVFYGAGRFCEKYIPLIHNKPESWRGLKVLVFINPTYWRLGLNGYSKEYQERYLSELQITQGYEKSFNKEKYSKLLPMNTLNLSVKVDEFMKRNYFNQFNKKLKNRIDPIPDSLTTSVFTPFGNPPNLASHLSSENIAQLKVGIDTITNCSYEFLKKHPDITISPVDTNSIYRYDALDYFIKLCEKDSINVTFVIGPYNRKIMESNKNIKEIKRYEALMQSIFKFMDDRSQKYVDLNYLSVEPYVFSDLQHHSKYGGYMIYKGIKEQLYE